MISGFTVFCPKGLAQVPPRTKEASRAQNIWSGLTSLGFGRHGVMREAGKQDI